MAMERAETRPMLGGLQSGIIALALAAAAALFWLPGSSAQHRAWIAPGT